MRFLPLCLLALMLTGCVREYHPISSASSRPQQQSSEPERRPAPRPAPVKVALANAFGFGGVNASLILRRWA